MIIKANNIELELRPTTRKIINLTEKNKDKNLSELYFKALHDCDVKVLAEIIMAFGEVEGKSPFNSDINKVYDFIDAYKKESKATYEDIYKELAEMVNSEGFFPKKMTKEELNDKISNPLASLNMEETIKTAADRVASEMMTEAFRGHQG